MKLIRISAVWCPACLIMRPIMNDIETLFPTVEHVEYDYDIDDEVSNYNVGDILPVFILKDGEKELTRIIGEKKKEEVINILKEYIDEK